MEGYVVRCVVGTVGSCREVEDEDKEEPKGRVVSGQSGCWEAMEFCGGDGETKLVVCLALISPAGCSTLFRCQMDEAA